MDPAAGMALCRALGLWQLGFPDQALAVVGESQRMAAAMTHRYSSTLMTGIATWVCVEMRMPRPEHDVETNMARMDGFPSLQTGARIVKGCVVAGLGRTEEGLAMLEGAVADWSAMGTRTFFCFNPCLLADVLLRAGRHDEALSLVERTLTAVPGQEDRNHWSELYRLKGDLLRSAGAPPAAVEEQLQRSLEIARQQAARSFELRSAMSLASLRALRADQGSREEARRQLAAVYDGFTEGLDTPDLVAARELLAELA